MTARPLTAVSGSFLAIVLIACAGGPCARTVPPADPTDVVEVEASVPLPADDGGGDDAAIVTSDACAFVEARTPTEVATACVTRGEADVMAAAIKSGRDGGAVATPCAPLPFNGFCASAEETLYAIDVVDQLRTGTGTDALPSSRRTKGSRSWPSLPSTSSTTPARRR